MIGFPFDSHVTFDENGVPNYDRAISSDPYRKLISQLFTTGILPTESTNMQVGSGEGMNVVVSAGFAIVEGCMKLEESDRTLAVQASHNTYDRIDTVVLRLDTNDDVRSCDFYIVEGTPASSPIRPELTRNNSVYEIGLADLFIPANSDTIQSYRITDTRYETERCGVISSISEFDTTFIYNQVQDDLLTFKENEEESFLTWSENQKTAFIAWYNTIKGILGEDEAGHILLLMGDLNNLTTETKTSLVGAINEVDMTTLKATEDESTDMDVPDVDADTLGGLYTAEDITQINSDLEQTDLDLQSSKLHEMQNITFPYTATENGFINYSWYSSTTGSQYMHIKDTTTNVVVSQFNNITNTGGWYSHMFPAIKGHTYNIWEATSGAFAFIQFYKAL